MIIPRALAAILMTSTFAMAAGAQAAELKALSGKNESIQWMDCRVEPGNDDAGAAPISERSPRGELA